MPEISVCIPAYEMGGRGGRFLTQALESIERQTYSNIEIIVSDNSQQNTEVREVCERFPVRYLKNQSKQGSSSANLNNALDHATGTYVKILCQDDLLASPDAIAEMKEALDQSGNGWLASGCIHSDENLTHQWDEHWPSIPGWVELALGQNGIGAPSVVMFKNNHLRFDDTLIWLMDCEFYYRMLKTFGNPCLIQKPLVIIRVWNGSVTNTLATSERRSLELGSVRRQIAVTERQDT